MEDLITLIGEDAVRKLAQAYGGQKVYIPTRADLSDRNQAMKHEFNDLLGTGSTVMNAYTTIANEQGLSVRRVQAIVNAR